MAINTYPGVYKKVALLIGGVAILLFSAFIIGGMTTSKEYGFLTLVLVLGLLGALLIFTHPTIGFALILFLVPLGPITRLIGGERAVTLALGALLLGIYGSRVLILHEKIKFDRVSLFACVFVAWGIITSVWASDPGASIKFAIRIGQMVGFYILVLNYCRSQRQLNILTLSFIAGTLVAAVVSIFKGVTIGETERVTFAEDYDLNIFSSVVSLAMILMFYYFYKTKYKLSKTVITLGIIIAWCVIIRAQSRTVWIAVAASFLITSVLLHRNSRIVSYAIKIIVVLLVVVAFAYYSGIISESVIKRFETLYYTFSEDPETRATGRWDIWKAGLEMIKDNPFLGVGLNNFKVVYKDYAPYARDSKGPHNNFVAVFAEMGLVGFIIFSGVFIYLFKNIWRIKDPITSFMFIWLFVCFIIESLTLLTYHVPWFWFVLVLIALKAKFEKQANQLITSKNSSYISG